MRHTSALKIIGFMRRSFGTPLSISAICRGVDLSYQPVHFHISELRTRGVIGVHREGRASICRFVASETASVWLGLLTGQPDGSSPGVACGLSENLQEYLSTRWPQYECISYKDGRNRIIAVPSAPADEELKDECRGVFAGGDVQLLARDDFDSFLKSEQGLEWIRSARVLFGHQRFWRYALTAGAARGLVVPADEMFLSERS